MRKARLSSVSSGLALGLVAFVALNGGILYAQDKVIYSPSGNQVVAPFVTATDESANFYGATWFGGTACGTVFELSPSGSGGWTETDLYVFACAPDGQEPVGVTRDAAGNLYGATHYGGAYDRSGCIQGCGMVFELSPNGDGSYTETVLYNFSGGRDGGNPVGNLVLDQAGNLYGVTVNGGTEKLGVVFKLAFANGAWTESVLHTFGQGTDGALPNAGLAFDKNGNIYGTTATGGTSKQGTVFELTPSGGTWKESVLHEFGATKTDGNAPFAGVVVDPAGNLYGTTSAGGGGTGCPGFGCGTVFRLSPSGSGWQEKILYRFLGVPDASSPDFGVILDARGNLYGAGGGGSETSCQLFGPCGTVYKLIRTSNGWKETVLHSFAGSPNDGNQPDSGVIFGKDGRLYGGTEYGGSATCTNSGGSGCGAIYELKP